MDQPRKRLIVILAGVGVVLGATALGVFILRREPPPAPEENWNLPEPTILAPVLSPQAKAVNQAVERAAAYMKKRLLEKPAVSGAGHAVLSDTQTGAAALVALALVEAGLPPGDGAVQKALGIVRTNQNSLRSTYAQGSVLLFLNRLHEAKALDEADQGLIRTLALRLIAGQRGDGLWGYYNPVLPPEGQARLLKNLESGSYQPTGSGGGYTSTSMSQFAMLALWGARKCGLPVRGPLLRVAARFHETQLSNGSWGYQPGTGPFDSNTCAGLMALAIEQALRDDPEFVREQTPLPKPKGNVPDMRRKAFAYLAPVIGQDPKKPNHPYRGYAGMGRLIGASANGDCYFLWCLERVAVIYDVHQIEGKDWYLWGSEVLLQAQKDDGSWSDGYDPVIDTAFAVLFLRRANLAKDLTDKLRMLGAQTRAGDPLPGRREC